MINKRHIAFVLLLITSISCVSEMGEEVVDIMTLPNEVPLDLMTRSGADIPRSYQKLPNPYSLKVMQKIYDDYSVEPVILEPTELYVCFKPQDTTQLRTLHEVPDLELFEYPLDIVLEEGEIVGMGKHEELMGSCEVYKEIALSQLTDKDLSDLSSEKEVLS